MPLRLTKFEYERLLARRKKPVGAQGAGSATTGTERLDRGNPALPAGRRWELEFAAQLDDAGYTGRYRREWKFLEDRRFRFDFAFIAEKLACEIDGAVHRTKKRFNADREKGQLALLGEWRVLHVTPKQVRNGEAISLLKGLIPLA